MRDNVSKLGTVLSGLAALPVNKVAVTGQTIDLANYNAATLYIPAGTWTDGTHTFTIQESDDASTWNNVDPSDLVAWIAASASDKTPVRVGNAQPSVISSAPTAVNQRIGYVGGKRYVRSNVAIGGSPATGAAYDLFWILGEPRFFPSAV